MRSVVLCGPCAPADVADLLSPDDRARAREMQGYRGVPVSELATLLVKRDVPVEVVTHAPGVREATVLSGPQFRLMLAPQRKEGWKRAADFFHREIIGMRNLLRATDGSVIHAHWTYEFALAALTDRRPVVVTAHDAPLTVVRRLPHPYRVARLLMAAEVRRRRPSLVAVSPYLRQAWRRQMFDNRPIPVLPTPAPRLPLATAKRASSQLLSVGDASRLKNVICLLRAMPEIRRVVPDATLRLVGPGLHLGGALHRRAIREGLTAGTEFVGSLMREQLAAEYAQATALIHPSLEESHGLVLVEAMSAGLPVVGGVRSGAVPWTLDNGRAGLLVDVSDPAAIATAATRLLTGRAEATRLAARGRRFATGRFDPELLSAQHLDLYDSLPLEARHRGE